MEPSTRNGWQSAAAKIPGALGAPGADVRELADGAAVVVEPDVAVRHPAAEVGVPEHLEVVGEED